VLGQIVPIVFHARDDAVAQIDLQDFFGRRGDQRLRHETGFVRLQLFHLAIEFQQWRGFVRDLMANYALWRAG